MTFDYGAASGAIDAYSRMARVLDAQAVARVAAGVEGAGYGPGPIYDAINRANDMQRTFNQTATEAREHPEPTGPRGPR